MDLTWTIEYAVQAGRARIVSFVWILPLTELRATESGIDRCVFDIFSVAPMLVFIVSGPAVSILCFGCARIAGAVAASGQPAIFACAKAGHE